jgi:hypothetical protein
MQYIIVIGFIIVVSTLFFFFIGEIGDLDFDKPERHNDKDIDSEN